MSVKIFRNYIKSCIRLNKKPDIKEIELLKSMFIDWGKLRKNNS